jgi:hypothetical protein
MRGVAADPLAACIIDAAEAAQRTLPPRQMRKHGCRRYMHSYAFGPAGPARGWEDCQTVALCEPGLVAARASAWTLEAAPSWTVGCGRRATATITGRATRGERGSQSLSDRQRCKCAEGSGTPGRLEEGNNDRTVAADCADLSPRR